MHYGNLIDAGVYHAARGNTAWQAGHSDAEREAALLRASEALDGQYGARFPGTKTGGRAQVREWPRSGAVDQCTGEELPDNAVPLEVDNAAYALALIELETPGSLNPSVTPGAQNKREWAGPVGRERFAAVSNVNAMRPIYATVDGGMRCLLLAKGGSRCLLRV